MKEFELIKVPNQSFNTIINDSVFEFTLRTFRGVTYITCSIDGEVVEAGVPCVANVSLFGGNINGIAGGIFKFISPNYDTVDWNTFGTIDCSLVFV